MARHRTGEIIHVFDETTLNAPLSGGVSIYPGDLGQVARRAFVTDHDGVIWAADFSATDITKWELRPMHDIFWDGTPLGGQPAYPPPILSVDNDGDLVVLQATGDIDTLDNGTVSNRVVSLTEVTSPGAGGISIYTDSLNWELRLHDGEQVTGPLELFEGTVYFASFQAGADPMNLCDLGESRIWGLKYLDHGGAAATGYVDTAGGVFPDPGFETTPGTGVFDQHFRGPFVDRLVLGVGVTQRPTCVSGGDVFDPYVVDRYRVTNVGGGTFVLTALMSGGGAAAAGGAALQTLEETLTAPQSFTSIGSFAGQVDE